MRFRLTKLIVTCLLLAASCAESSSYPSPASFLPSPAAYPPPATLKFIPTNSPVARLQATITSSEIINLPPNTPTPAQTTMAVYVGDEFQIKIGQEFFITGPNFYLRFIAALDDTRCPTASNFTLCKWEGNVETVFRVTGDALESHFVGLNTCGNCQKNAFHGDYQITLLKVDPDPKEIPIDPSQIRWSNYVATLVVETANGP